MENHFKIDFIGIGTARAASTWIAKCLEEHPQICIASTKDVSFFDEEYKIKSRNYLEQYFRHCSVENKGAFSLTYLTDPKMPLLLKKYFSETKLIACLRHPIERVYSHYWLDKSIKKIGKNISFKEAIKKDQKYIQLGLYYHTLRDYSRLFPPENLLILIYEDIQKDPLKFIQKIYKFLGIDYTFRPSLANQRINPATKQRLKIDFINERNIGKLINLSKSLKQNLIGKVFVRIIETLRIPYLIYHIQDKNIIDKFGIKLKTFQKPPIKTRTRKYLQEIYKEDIEKLEKLLNRDLSFWQ